MSDKNVAALGGFGFPNWFSGYQNQVWLNDICDTTMYSPMGMFSMNDSIFNGGMMNPMMGTFPSFMGGSGNYKDYYKQYEEHQKFSIDSMVNNQMNSITAERKLNAPIENIKHSIRNLSDKISENEQQQILPAFNALKDSVRALNPQASEVEVTNTAISHYEKQTNRNLINDIREKGNSALTQGFWNTLTLGLIDDRCADDNVAELTGQPVGKKKQYQKTAGHAIGAGTLTAGTCAGLRLLTKKLPNFKWSAAFTAIATIGTAIYKATKD